MGQSIKLKLKIVSVFYLLSYNANFKNKTLSVLEKLPYQNMKK